MKRTTALLALAAVTFVVPLDAGDDEDPGITVRYRPAIGSVLELRQEVRQAGDIDIAGQGSQSFASDMVLAGTQRVEAGAAEDTVRLTQVIDRLEMTVRQGPAEILAIDTEDEASSDEAAALKNMVGREFTLEIDDSGTIRSVSGLREMVQDVAASDDPAAKQVAAMLEQSFNDDAMRQMMQAAMPVFSEEPLRPGDSWTQSADATIPVLGPAKVESTYTFERLDEHAGEPCLRLAVELDVTFDLDDSVFEEMFGGEDLDLSMNMEPIDTSGWVCVASADGVTLVAEMKQTMSMSFEATSPEPGQDVAMTMSLDQIVRQTSTRR